MNPITCKKNVCLTHEKQVLVEDIKKDRLKGDFSSTYKQNLACFNRMNEKQCFYSLVKRAIKEKKQLTGQNQPSELRIGVQEDKWYDDLCVVSRIFFGILDRLTK